MNEERTIKPSFPINELRNKNKGNKIYDKDETLVITQGCDPTSKVVPAIRVTLHHVNGDYFLLLTEGDLS